MSDSPENKVRILMIRHGMTAGNEEKRYIGRTDESLSDLGRERMFKTLEAKGDLFTSVKRVYASPMKRCLESAAIIFGDLQPIVIEDLREIDFGLFEGKNYMELSGNEAYQAWIDSKGSLPFPEGEARTEFIERCIRGFDRVIQEIERSGESGIYGMLVHGGTIMAILSTLAGGDYYDYQVANGEGYVVDLAVKGEEYRLLSVERL